MLLLQNYEPALMQGAKILPQNLAGIVGQPYVGNIFYVDATNGSDTANDGTSQNNAFKTLYKAHSAMSDNHHDVAIVTPGGTGSGTGTNESVYGAWTWSKSLCTVVGNAAPSLISPRARVLWDTAGQSTTGALLTVTGNGLVFSNIQLGTFVDNNILVKQTGDRNVWSQVHFAGIGDATAGDDTAARSLWLSDGDESVFAQCTIGVDTVARSVANAEIEFSDQVQRCQFLNCKILSYADNAGHLFVKANAASSAIDRWVSFENCGFINPPDSAATTMTDAMAVDASLGGSIILINSWKLGATGWADNLTPVRALSISSNATYANGIGFPVNPGA